VASAEGISLEEAIHDQRALFGTEAEAEAEGMAYDEWLALDNYYGANL
jgi:hypothetical protein